MFFALFIILFHFKHVSLNVFQLSHVFLAVGDVIMSLVHRDQPSGRETRGIAEAPGVADRNDGVDFAMKDSEVESNQSGTSRNDSVVSFDVFWKSWSTWIWFFGS